MKNYMSIPEGVCPKEMSFDLDGEQMKNLSFIGGCKGNLTALSKVLEEKTIDEISKLFKGQTCGKKESSCMDQLVLALEKARKESI